VLRCDSGGELRGYHEDGFWDFHLLVITFVSLDVLAIFTRIMRRTLKIHLKSAFEISDRGLELTAPFQYRLLGIVANISEPSTNEAIEISEVSSDLYLSTKYLDELSRSDFAACTSVALPFPLTSTTGSFLVVYGSRSRLNFIFINQFEGTLLLVNVMSVLPAGEDLEIIQEEDTHPSIDTSLNHEEDDLEMDEPQSDIIPIRRSTRTRRPTDRMCLYIDAEEHELGDLGEPANYKAALLDPESDKWLTAMNVEMQSMKDNEVWILVELPPNGKTVGSKWLFKKKTDMDGAVHTYKARLVAKGYTQTPGIDYEETFSPVADIRAIRILIAIAAYYDYEIWQMDVKTAFLNGYLNEEVYMEQPEGFVNPKYPNRVCKLKRSIYGLKQASRQWNKRFDDEIKKFGFSQNADEPCVYLKASGSNVTFLILYVDDILIMGNNIPMLQDVKSYLGKCFAMKDLGEAAYILGIKIYRDRSRRLIGLCQSAYIEKILKRFHMENSKRGSIPMQEKLRLSKSQGASTPAELKRMQNVPYASAVGSIMYAVRCTRPDVANTKDMFLVSGGDLKREFRISCYTNAGYLTDADDLKSQTGYVFVLNGGVVNWKSAKQSIFATSSAEAEYIAAFDASKEAVWVRKFIYGLGVVPTIEKPINMYCDNTGAIAIANESGITKGARHFRAKVHYLREVIEFGDIKLEKVQTDDNLADPFTKALAFPKHSELTRNIGMLPATNDKQTPNVPTKSTDGKQTLTLATNKVTPVSSSSCVHVDDGSESDVEDVFDETGTLWHLNSRKMVVVTGPRACMKDPYDDDVHNANGLTEDQESFCNAWDIKLRGRMKK
ncbi:retrotransposon protein, putative, ty1-copia subclass, partial [Tanacetum coccineum]